MSPLKDLFTLRGSVGRSQYLAAGLGLAMVKYAVDAGSCFALTGEFWDPKTYLNPTFAERMRIVEFQGEAYLAFLVLWALPFLWIGVAMSSRRARDAGYSPWLGLGFLLPLLNYPIILVLVALPGRPGRDPSPPPGPVTSRTALIGVTATILLGTGLIALLTEVMHDYGTALFLGLPFLLGAVTGYLFNLTGPRGPGATIGAASLALLVGFLALLAFALEGFVCLVMAYPIMWAAVVPGALFGRALVSMSVRPDRTLGLVILCLPLSAALQKPLHVPGAREVATSIGIDAPPEVVWQNVVAFSELPVPEDWIFGTGISYPLRARIEGQGVGAVRHCEFTTGSFVEPITTWDEPRRLSFDVIRQPLPMREWSFYEHIHPPHLEESFRSVRGEFRLTPRPGGGTLLEGSTWYELDLGPTTYWAIWAEAVLHRIHGRVLRHVKRLSEAAGG